MQMRASIENYDIVKIPKIPKEMPTVALSPQACLMCLMAADNCGASPPPLQSGGRLVEQNLSNADLSFSHSKFPLEISKKNGLRVAREQVEAVGWGPSSSVLGYRNKKEGPFTRCAGPFRLRGTTGCSKIKWKTTCFFWDQCCFHFYTILS